MQQNQGVDGTNRIETRPPNPQNGRNLKVSLHCSYPVKPKSTESCHFGINASPVESVKNQRLSVGIVSR